MSKLSETQKISHTDRGSKNKVHDILISVYTALEEKGYNPINQIVGYIISGDPTYITNHKGARTLITTLERDELLEEIVWYYLNEDV
ncbi:MAG: IreB family regulatory phosphoprotein [Defluviitaleaceae bacterium]|nr:IreB family regulatory phosphoprotein [Defluviitaleaceae bacterium]